jgi:enamine deaminase RidA (YjgF/YER057c/UK114 family)
MESRPTSALSPAAAYAALLLICACAAAQAQSAAKQSPAPSKSTLDSYHAGPWEQEIGYSQAVRVGHMLYISGTVGADAKGQPEDVDGQMKKAYAGIEKTLAHYHTDFSHVVMERIYTTDIEALIRNQKTRKQFYGDSLPAATWVEVKRLYGAADKIEIEVQVALD